MSSSSDKRRNSTGFGTFSIIANAVLVVLIFTALTQLAGCMSPERAVREADEAGNRIAENYIEKITGRTNEFAISRPSYRLRNRLLIEQSLNPELAAKLGGMTNTVPQTKLPDPLILSLSDAFKIGVENADDYQTRKEALFSKALELDLTRHDFENTFAGALGANVSRSENDGDTFQKSENAGGKASSSLSRKLENGATLAASIGLDIIKLLTGGDSTLGFTSDLSYSIPLLRGSGRKIAIESLTQGERDLMYAVHDFESFRESFAIKIATLYYDMLSVEQKLAALRENSDRLTDNYKRAQMLSDAGRLSQVELDQTRQELLNTGDNLVSEEKSRQAQLDSFKISLGLPVDSRIELDMRELDRLRKTMGLDSATATNVAAFPRQPPLLWSEEDAIAIALTNRTELIIARQKLEDSKRKLEITKDALRFGLDLKLGANYGKNKVNGESATDKTGYTASLTSDIPWDKKKERNNYRNALISIDAQERALETLEDETRQLIRSDIRNINSAWSSFIIQSEALTVALRRVRSTTLFQQAGKSSTRDMLEAESSLLSARNSVVSAIVAYRMAGLKLKQDISMLNISEEGLLLED